MNAKLTDLEAAEIRWLMALQAVVTTAAIAEEYRISETQVRKIARGEKWKEAGARPTLVRLENRIREKLKASSPSPSAPQASVKPTYTRRVAWMNF